MTALKTTRSLLMMLAVTAMSAALFAGSAEAYTCKSPSIKQYGTLRVAKGVAIASAKTKWSQYVKSHYGLPWSVWSIAKSKNVGCKKKGHRWLCHARAIRCLYVVP
jgi:hypothetical protein